MHVSRKEIITWLFLAVFILFSVGLIFYLQSSSRGFGSVSGAHTSLKEQESLSNNFSYQGKDGKDALSLLREKAKVELDNSGMVVSINGRKADSGKHEFWEFLINGKMAEVGPADYKTQDGDLINWKISTY